MQKYTWYDGERFIERKQLNRILVRTVNSADAAAMARWVDGASTFLSIDRTTAV
jgi:hypothetical protein